MIKYILLAQIATIPAPSPPMSDSQQVPVYSWEKPTQSRVWQRPLTGIYTPSGGPNLRNIEEMLEEE